MVLRPLARGVGVALGHCAAPAAGQFPASSPGEGGGAAAKVIQEAPLMPLDQSTQTHFDFLLPRNREWLSPKAVAAIIGRSENFVREALENQKIMGHVANGSARREEEKRYSYLIHRDCVLIYLGQTANYTPHDFIDQLFELIQRRLGYDELKALGDHIQSNLKTEAPVYG